MIFIISIGTPIFYDQKIEVTPSKFLLLPVIKRYFINRYHISQYTRQGGGALVMECGDEVLVSRRKRGEIGVVLGL